MMLLNNRIHLCLLIGRQIEAGQRNCTRHLRLVSNLLCAVAMLAREHCCCRKESRRYYRNEFGHSGNLDISAAIIVQNAWQLQGGSRDSTKMVGCFAPGATATNGICSEPCSVMSELLKQQMQD